MKQFRRVAIDAILSTDMKAHFGLTDMLDVMRKQLTPAEEVNGGKGNGNACCGGVEQGVAGQVITEEGTDCDDSFALGQGVTNSCGVVDQQPYGLEELATESSHCDLVKKVIVHA